MNTILETIASMIGSEDNEVVSLHIDKVEIGSNSGYYEISVTIKQ